MIGPRGKARIDAWGDDTSPESFFDLSAEEVRDNPPEDPKGELFALPNQKPVPHELRVRDDYAAWRDQRRKIKVLTREQRAALATLICDENTPVALTQAETGASEVSAVRTALAVPDHHKEAHTFIHVGGHLVPPDRAW